MLSDELSRIAKGIHPEPHRWLGCHETDAGWVARVFDPSASSVRIRRRAGDRWSEAHPIVMTDEGCFFEARLEGSGHSLLDVSRELVGGRVVTSVEPFSFPVSVDAATIARFSKGELRGLAQSLGANERVFEGVAGVAFAVWAPAALAVSVMGSFNEWHRSSHAMRRLAGGIWELFVPGAQATDRYKFNVTTRKGVLEKSDPLGKQMELRPDTASVVYASQYRFEDDRWIERRRGFDVDASPVSIYEVHLPSWRRPDASRSSAPFKTYAELADELIPYVNELGFTHVELLPVLEHPYDGSWGYQVSGYFAPTSRMGTPDDFKRFVDRCHRAGLGVILDWVPAHFPRDASALGRFDGTPLYEHWDPRRGEHRQWETFVFDWGRPEVRNFLIESALYWIEEFHLDGLRVDAVASMLYLDYGSQSPTDWEPNAKGGRENLEAVAFLRALTDAIHAHCPGVMVTAEESTSWPGVTRSTALGGLGFDLKWNMGWMHDTLSYFSTDPLFRSGCHSRLTFGLMYVFSERHLLPLSHDEVVHLKRSLLSKLPGDLWQQSATLRALYAHMWAHPGKKLLFMGGELGQATEWNFHTELEWSAMEDPLRRKISRFLRDLNALYRQTPALFELDHSGDGFLWVDANGHELGTMAYLRMSRITEGGRSSVLVVCNFTPVPRIQVRVGVPWLGVYLEVLNSDSEVYGGSNVGNFGKVEAAAVASHGFENSIVIDLPPLAVMYFLAPNEPPKKSVSDEQPVPKGEKSG